MTPDNVTMSSPSFQPFGRVVSPMLLPILMPSVFSHEFRAPAPSSYISSSCLNRGSWFVSFRNRHRSSAKQLTLAISCWGDVDLLGTLIPLIPFGLIWSLLSRDIRPWMHSR